jgi:hypothetical protein
MRNRHLPRLCRTCGAPMAGQEARCWRCGVEWASEETPPTTLRLIRGGAPSQPEDVPDRPIAVAAARLAGSAGGAEES